MVNIFKSSFHQVKKDKLLISALVATLFLPAIVFMAAYWSEDQMTVGILLSKHYTFIGMAIFYSLVLCVTRMFGTDLADKFINYEMLGGHARGTVYFARVLISFLVFLPAALVSLVLPIGLISLRHGFGRELTGAEVASLIVAAMCVLFRLGAECMVVNLITKSLLGGMLGTMLGEEVLMIIFTLYGEASGMKDVVWVKSVSGLSRLMFLFDMQNTKMDFADGKDFTRILLPSDPSLQLADTVGSLVIGIVLLAASYVWFSKKDV